MRWTCRKCKTVWPRSKQRCTCGRKRPARRKPAHLAVLDELSYEEAVRRAGGRETCGICGVPPGTRRLHRDHDHKTGEFRGLLCFRCNTALRGYMTAEWLRKAADYLDG